MKTGWIHIIIRYEILETAAKVRLSAVSNKFICDLILRQSDTYYFRCLQLFDINHFYLKDKDIIRLDFPSWTRIRAIC